MAKKIKLPLAMANGVTVRTLEELKENWDLGKIIEYYHNGRLINWLNDRYYTDIVEEINKLNEIADPQELQKQLCDIFGVTFEEEKTVDVKAITEKDMRYAELRKFTADDKILSNVEKVAFNKNEFADLLNTDENPVYLFNNQFEIPLNIKNKHYVGVGDVTAIINSDELFDFNKVGITFDNIKFDTKYNSMILLHEELKKAEEAYLAEDYQKAFPIFKKLAEMGYGRAMFFVGEYYRNGYGNVVEINSDAGFNWHKKGGQHGDPLAGLNYAYSYPKDSYERINIVKKYFDSVKALADNGDAIAQNELASMYRYGEGTEKNVDKAVEYYEKAAEGGYVKISNMIGNIYYSGEGGSKQSFEAAIKWYKRAIDEGNAWGLYNLAKMYFEGEGVEKNYDEAEKLYKQAAEQGLIDAEWALGYLYENRCGSEDIEEAMIWYRKAAEKGNIQSLHDLGRVYQDYFENFNEAIKWFLKAAEQGNVKSMSRLGTIYITGKSGEVNYKEAKRWFSEAAEKGYGPAQYNLGKMYNDGDGVPQDLDKATELYQKAADQGVYQAQAALKRLAGDFSDDIAYEKARQEAIKDLERQKKEIDKLLKKSDSNCFITTAVCGSLNKRDDCDELMSMRWLRDRLRNEDTDMGALIEEYYRVAPLIVKKINSASDAPLIYRRLWDNSISKIYKDIKQKAYHEAKLRYISMLEDLCLRYNEPLTPGVKERIERVRVRKSYNR